MADGALAGLRVLDLSRLLPGPFATMVLVDLGAQVDKLEDVQGGDYLRLMPPQVGGMNASFVALNRGKRSLALDLKRAEGREALLRLIERYDVLVESFRPGVLGKLGLGYEQLSARNPRLIYCAITGYGQTGPLRERAGHDINYLARGGVLGLTGPVDAAPQVPGVQMADIAGGGLYAVVGILAALQQRERTGEGSLVDTAMCEGSLSLALIGLTSHYAGLGFSRGEGLLAGGIAPYGTYLCKGGGAVALGALEPKFWKRFCDAAGIEYSMEALAPGPHQADWKRRVAEAIAGRTRDEWAQVGAAVDCCIEPVLAPDELLEDPHHRERGAMLAVPAGDGVVHTPRTPLGGGALAPAPAHGEHSEQILREAGLSDAEIAALSGAR